MGAAITGLGDVARGRNTMAKAVKVLCDRCENKIIAGVSFCDHCTYPTRWATHEERTMWEVNQWKAADRSHTPKSTTKTDRSGRRWKPFGRKQDSKPALTLVSASPAKAEPAKDITIELEPVAMAAAESGAATAPAASVSAPAAPVARPERTIARPKPVMRAKPEPAPIAKPAPAPKLPAGKADDEPVTDTPATIMAMRLLNARVKELDAKIQKLQAELEASRRS